MVSLCFFFQEWQQMCLNFHICLFVLFMGDVGQIQSSVKDNNAEAGNCYASLQTLIFLCLL
jgi:hypothetical protein